jgi:pyridoxal phosphate enzyme (YggS family)
VEKIEHNLTIINKQINDAENKYNRKPGSVCLLAVSKKHSIELIKIAHSLGQNHFGENFVQEGVEKIHALKSKKLCWHFIGHIQSNKTRIIAENFDWVHTVDRLKIAERLSKQRPNTAKDLNICVQVNIDREDAKSGVYIEELGRICNAIQRLPKLKLRGLMCIPIAKNKHSDQRLSFAKLNNQKQLISQNLTNLDTLSMGMTNDYMAAIQEGATIIRIGTALFGAR